MTGSRSPDAHAHAADAAVIDDGVSARANGHRSPYAAGSASAAKAELSREKSGEEREQHVRDMLNSASGTRHLTMNGGEDDAASEAETLIDSPVKRREMEKQNAAARMEKPARHRIGGLPVPSGDDEASDSMASPMQSTEMSDIKGTSSGDAKGEDVDDMDLGSSGSLSSAHSSPSEPASRSSSRSRALSEMPERLRNGEDASNPLKRKHRASSVGLPNKRQSMEPPKRKLRGMHSEDGAIRTERSPSPKPRAHRRTASTQSAFVDGTAESSGRKRRAITQFPVRDPKSAKPTWEESDASSETTSHGHNESSRRPQRGVGRSTSTPGRPVGREHKRHVNKYGFTRLAEACEAGELDMVKEWREKDPDQLELAEFAGNKPLQIAALNGNVEVVEYLIDQGCQIDCANVDKDTPLIDAAENGHLDVVRILLNAGVDPLRQNLKGQQALDVVTDDTDDADGIRAALRQAIESWNSDDAKQRREEEEEQRHRAGPTKELHFMARTYENLLRLVTINDRNGVREFLDARVPVDNAVIAMAAKTGDLYLVNMLLAEMTEKKAYQKAEKPMLSVLGTSHWEMVKALTELDQFNPLYRSRAGKTWPELAEERNGPNWRQEKELLQRLYDQRSSISHARHSSSPVTKRDNGKRRYAQDDDEDSDEEDAPKRKNGRRLMSRRDMRAASGKAHSDSESDESMSDAAHDDASMKPPGSPPQKRVPGRPRTNSSSSQQDNASPGNRRRSSSFRGVTDHVLPTVEEKAEERTEERVTEQIPKGRSLEEKSREEEAKFAIEQAQRLEAKRKQEDEAEIEAKRAEEAARKAEEERQAEDARIKLEEEEARVAEEAKRLEEERQRHEAQMEAARRQHRTEVLNALPPTLRRTFDPSSDFDYDGIADLSYLVEHFTPLLIVKRGRSGLQDSLSAEESDDWVLNAQVAPLLGKRGIELLLHRTSLGFERTFSEGWSTFDDFSATERRVVERVVTEITSHVDIDEDAEMADNLSLAEELRLTAARYNAVIGAKKKLLDGTAALYCVKLQDVLRHLDPLLQGTSLEVRSLVSSTPSSDVDATLDSVVPAKGQRPSDGFLARLTDAWGRSTLPRKYKGGQLVEQPVLSSGMTDVVVVHEK